MRKLLWQDQSRQGIDFIDPRIAQLRWLAIKRRFIQRLPKKVSRFIQSALTQQPVYIFEYAPRSSEREPYMPHTSSFEAAMGAKFH
jgi:hypothetical protein